MGQGWHPHDEATGAVLWVTSLTKCWSTAQGHGTRYGIQGRGILGLSMSYYVGLGQEAKVWKWIGLGDLTSMVKPRDKGVKVSGVNKRLVSTFV